jgi:hypothetical protein
MTRYVPIGARDKIIEPVTSGGNVLVPTDSAARVFEILLTLNVRPFGAMCCASHAPQGSMRR